MGRVSQNRINSCSLFFWNNLIVRYQHPKFGIQVSAGVEGEKQIGLCRIVTERCAGISGCLVVLCPQCPVQWVQWRLRVFIWLIVFGSRTCLLSEKARCWGRDQVWVFWVRKEVIIIKTIWISYLALQTVFVVSNRTGYCCASRNAFHLEMLFMIPMVCAFSLFQTQGPSLKLVRSSKWKIHFSV